MSDDPRRMPPSDVWAWGMLVWEVRGSELFLAHYTADEIYRL